MKKTMGLLVMAYGTPRKKEDIEPYYTHIRRGRRPSDEQLADLTERYEKLGGTSPLAKITDEQALRLEQRLNEVACDVEFKLYLGLKHMDPFIEDAILQMKDDGITEAVSLVLAPHYSTFSVKSYNGRAIEESESIHGPKIHAINSWYNEPKFIDFWAKTINDVLKKVPKQNEDQTIVIFSAHSLPERILKMNDPYIEQLKETADLITKKADLKHYTIGFQSAGATPEPWIGPDVQDLTRDLYNKGYREFIYCPVGFVSEHLEVLYDNDYECKVVTDELGAHYYRTPMPNASEAFIDALATVVLNKLAEG